MVEKKKDLMTVADVAAEKGVTTTAVLYAIYDGRLPATKLGRIWVLRRPDVASYSPRAYSRRPTHTHRVPRTQSG